MHPKALILHADGINRDLEAAEALALAGARPEIVHLNQLRSGARRWGDYQILVIPGGFSYADALGGGRLLAIDLDVYFAEEVGAFVEGGKPVIGICNGFQALVKAGILPDIRDGGTGGGRRRPQATLTFNASGRFECRWVTLKPMSRTCIWTRDLFEPVLCPVAHGEGRFMLACPGALAVLEAQHQIALIYAHRDGTPASGCYPANPNGSIADIAGVCNLAGNVLGLMPHPEDHIRPHQHARWTRGESGGLGLKLFENGVKYAAQL